MPASLDMLADAKAFIADMASSAGEDAPDIDEDVLAQVMAALLDGEGEDNEPDQLSSVRLALNHGEKYFDHPPKGGGWEFVRDGKYGGHIYRKEDGKPKVKEQPDSEPDPAAPAGPDRMHRVVGRDGQKIGETPSYDPEKVPESFALPKEAELFAAVESASAGASADIGKLYAAAKEVESSLSIADFHRQMIAWTKRDLIATSHNNDPRLSTPEELAQHYVQEDAANPHLTRFVSWAKPTGELFKPGSPAPETQPPAAAVPTPAKADPAHVQAAHFIIKQLAGRENLVSLAKVRAGLTAAGFRDRGEQDAAINELRRQGKVSASVPEGRHGATEEEKAAWIREGDNALGYLSVRMSLESKPLGPLTIAETLRAKVRRMARQKYPPGKKYPKPRHPVRLGGEQKIGNGILSRVQAAYLALSDEERDGLEVWYNAGPPERFVIDQMDWHGGEGGKKVIAAAELATGSKASEDEDAIVKVQNEGGKPEGGWIKLEADGSADRLSTVHAPAGGGVVTGQDEDPEEMASLIADILYGLYGENAEGMLGEANEEAEEIEGDGTEHPSEDSDLLDTEQLSIARLGWNAIDHPRGKGGRFIPRGSPEAVAAAKEAIGKVLAGTHANSPEHAEEVLKHLSILTVKQLKELHKEHGKPAPGKLREHLVSAVKARLEAGKPKEEKEENAETARKVDQAKKAGEQAKAVSSLDKRLKTEAEEQAATFALGKARTDSERRAIIDNLSPDAKAAIADRFDAPHLQDDPTSRKIVSMAKGEQPKEEPKEAVKDSAIYAGQSEAGVAPTALATISADNPLLQGMKAVEPDADSGGLVSIRELRQKFGLSKEEFDAAIMGMVDSGALAGHRENFTAGKTPAELASLVDTGMQTPDGDPIYFTGLSVRDNTPEGKQVLEAMRGGRSGEVEAETPKSEDKAEAAIPETAALASAGQADLPRKVEELMRQLEPDADQGAMVAITELRQKAGASKAEFDRAILDMAISGKVDLHRHVTPGNLTEEERDALVTDGEGNYFIGIAKRDGAGIAADAGGGGEQPAGVEEPAGNSSQSDLTQSTGVDKIDSSGETPAGGKAMVFTAKTYRGTGRTDAGSVYDPLLKAVGGVLGNAAEYHAMTPEHAKRYGPDVFEHEVSLVKPLHITSDIDWRAVTAAAGVPSNLAKHTIYSGDVSAVKAAQEKLLAHLQSSGYDGVVVKMDKSKPIKGIGELFGHDQIVKLPAGD